MRLWRINVGGGHVVVLKPYPLNLKPRNPPACTTSKGTSSTQSFETGLNFFPRNWWLEAKLRSYSGFTTNVEDSDDAKFVDLWILDMYFSSLWMATAHGKFSPRSAYFLDRRQAESAGSMILGGRIQRNIAEDKDSVLAYYDNRRDLKTLWLDMG